MKYFQHFHWIAELESFTLIWPLIHLSNAREARKILLSPEVSRYSFDYRYRELYHCYKIKPSVAVD